jgi:hypothetical protein
LKEIDNLGNPGADRDILLQLITKIYTTWESGLDSFFLRQAGGGLCEDGNEHLD